MKTIVIILIIIWVCLSCTNNRNIQPTEVSSELLFSSDTLKNKDTIFSEPMKSAIDTFIQYIGNLDFITPIERNVLCFYFHSKAETDYVSMSVEPYYRREKIKGYTYIGKYIFVYYGEENIGNRYFDKSKLLSYQDTVPGFSAYEDMPIGIYEPYGVTFQIVDSMHFILVRKGML